jgi:MFS superfamily sulfate permease-like transporter
MGVVVSLLAVAGVVDRLARLIPRAVVRGILLGLGVKLAWQGLTWVAELPIAGADSLATTLLTGGALVLLAWRKLPAALLVFLAGLGLEAVARPDAFEHVTLALPSFQLALPGEPAAWWSATVKAVLPQLPLTLLNSVVAVCSLSAVYFPGYGIRPRDMALSVGLMNLVGVPLGSFPLCHGSGGLAAQYRFGARTGASVILLGGVKMALGLLFGGTLLLLLAAYPKAVLGPMLVAAGVELARVASGEIRAGGFVIAVGTALGCVIGTTTVGLGVGIAMVLVQRTSLWAWALGRWYAWRNSGRDPAPRD